MIAFVVKEPATTHGSPGGLPQKISIEQVERALDDMDMLKQLSAPLPSDTSTAERI
jgi:hypothetical protein